MSSLETLVAGAAAGDSDAWQELWSVLEPRLSALVRKPHFIGQLARRDDAVRDIVVAVMGRLREHDFQRLNTYLEARRADPTLHFMRWLIVVAKRVAIDCLRAHPDYVDRRRSAAAASDTPGFWVETQELPAEHALPGVRPPMTNRVTARQILRYAGDTLSPPQRRALELWADGADTADIAAALALESPAHAERLVRAAVERLRRHFRGEQPG